MESLVFIKDITINKEGVVTSIMVNFDIIKDEGD